VRTLLSRLAIILAAVVTPIQSVSWADEPGCIDAEIFGQKLLSNFCWKCLFPVQILGVPVGGGRAPLRRNKSPVCLCPGKFGYPSPGYTIGMWDPARLIEHQRVPGCSSVLNGTRLPFNRMQQGHHGEPAGEDDMGKSYQHYHYFAFPLMYMIGAVRQCAGGDAMSDMDILYLSELDPTWNNSSLSFFTTPEAAAVANPIAALACIPDAISSTAGHPIDEMFWCAGAHGTLYPLVGHVTGSSGPVEDTSLLNARVLAALHRRGLAWKTMGSGALCGGMIWPTLPKSQYKFTLYHPIPETKRAHVIGESKLVWGMARTIPAVGEDLIYMIWRWKDCCITFY